MGLEKINRTGWFFLGATAGAFVAYALDPDNGRHRRVIMRDQGIRAGKDLSRRTARKSHDLAHRTKGMLIELGRNMRTSGPVDDMTLVNRVRTHIGRVTRHSKPIGVEAFEGVITLSGPVLMEEVDRICSCAESVPGVKKVINFLEIHEDASHISSLQGRGQDYKTPDSQGMREVRADYNQTLQ